MKAAIGLAALLLAGCASSVETVQPRMLLQPGAAKYQMPPLDLFVMPIELEAPVPGFPDAVTAAEVPAVEACAELWLSVDGEVTHVAAVHDLPGCSGADDPGAAPFQRSVLEALRHWSFTPARICHFREDQRGQRARGDCRGDVAVQRVPVRLAYAFRFERHKGRAQVGSRPLPR